MNGNKAIHSIAVKFELYRINLRSSYLYIRGLFRFLFFLEYLFQILSRRTWCHIVIPFQATSWAFSFYFPISIHNRLQNGWKWSHSNSSGNQHSMFSSKYVTSRSSEWPINKDLDCTLYILFPICIIFYQNIRVRL